MEKDKKVIVIITVISILLLLITGITAAWLSFETDGGTNKVESANLEIVYKKGKDFYGDLISSVDRFGGINTTVTINKTSTSVDAKMNLYLNIVELPQELRTSSLKWEVYREGENEALAIGTFQNYYPDSTITLVSNVPVSDTPTDYTVYIWLDKSTVNYTSVHEKEFFANITASATQAIADTD